MCENQINELLKDFLLKELIVKTWSSAVSRSSIYKEGVREEEKTPLRDSGYDYLRQFSREVGGHTIKEQTVIDKIQHMADALSQQHKDILCEGRFRIGTAQKAINVLLKYLWAMGWIQGEPPHCPLDRIILKKAKIDVKDVKWTEMDSMDEYQKNIEVIRKVAGTQTIAQWELKNWERK